MQRNEKKHYGRRFFIERLDFFNETSFFLTFGGGAVWVRRRGGGAAAAGAAAAGAAAAQKKAVGDITSGQTNRYEVKCRKPILGTHVNVCAHRFGFSHQTFGNHLIQFQSTDKVFVVGGVEVVKVGFNRSTCGGD